MKRLFSPGLEQANLVMTSNILELLWNRISKLSNAHEQSSSSLEYDLYYDDQKQCTVVTFVAWPGSNEYQLLEGADLVSSSSSIAKESFALFEFLHKKTEFAISRAAITFFHQHLHQLSLLKNQIDLFKPIIVTGHALGGSIASLFTLWLLESMSFSRTKRPICITFGSPLIGDIGLQKALFLFPPWNSCFLHVVSNNDPIPRKFINHNANAYKPFGIFLLCSNSGCSCFEEPETILELLAVTTTQGAANQGPNHGVDYGKIVEHLKRNALFKNSLEVDWATNPYAAGIATQLSAIEYKKMESVDIIKTEAKRMEKQEKKYLIGKTTVNPYKKLNEAKINMAKLEWYKKASEKIGYYDSYKSKMFMSDINVEEIVKRLVNYWTYDEAGKQPRKEGALFSNVLSLEDRINSVNTLFKDVFEVDWERTCAVGIVTQLSAIEEEVMIKIKSEKMEKQEKKYLTGKRTVGPDKNPSEDKGTGYYDTYKSKMFMNDINVKEIVKRLVNYWTDLVEAAEKLPQKEGASFLTRWLYVGMAYKGMVEPLYIAEYLYYNKEKGFLHYENSGRLKHFVQLEKLLAYLKETTCSASSIDQRRKNVSRIWTTDSSFWAKVEKAIILCNSMKDKDADFEEQETCKKELKEFEEHVMFLLEHYEVSPEIFLEHSSFIQWWRNYKEAMGRSYSSPLTDFMARRQYEDYSQGNL